MLNMKEFCRERRHVLFGVLAALFAVGALIVVLTITTAPGQQASAPNSGTEPVTSVASRDTTASPAVSTPDATPVFYNVLSGEPCTEDEASVRPAAVMINNIPAALPQIGIGNANVIYECEVEGGLTRMLAVFSHYADITDPIGSVRSSREYYLDFCANHDAFYVHAGGSEEAYSQLKSRLTDHIDGVNGGATGYFYRDPERLQTMSYEHTLVITGARIAQAMQDIGYRTTVAADYQSPYTFAHDGTAPVGDTKAGTLETAFNAYSYASFTYDAVSGRYLRFQRGDRHIDGASGEQLSFETVLILFCPYTYTGDDKGHISVSTVGEGDGYCFADGYGRKITWEKESPDTPVVLTEADGSPLLINPGKIFVSVLNDNRRDTLTVTP